MGGRRWQPVPLKGAGVIVQRFSVVAVTAILTSLLANRAHCWVLRQHAVLFLDQDRESGLTRVQTVSQLWPFAGLGGRCSLSGVGVWLVFENCIVDASIFDRLW
jgi:hypothetical protein